MVLEFGQGALPIVRRVDGVAIPASNRASPLAKLGSSSIINSDCRVLASTRVGSAYRDDRLLLGKQIGKDIFRSLPELESLMRI